MNLFLLSRWFTSGNLARFSAGTVLLAAVTFATRAETAAPIKHRILVAEYGKAGNRLVEISAEGKLVWEHKPPSAPTVIFEALPNGNVLYAYGGQPTGVQEIDRDHKVVWNHISKCPQVLGCRRLPNGNTLVAEQGPCQSVEVNAKGEVVKTIKLTTSEVPFHRQVRNIQQLPNGNILAAHEGDGVVREVNSDGKVIWAHAGIENVFEALRLENGNTLISCGTQKRVIEVTPAGKVVWEFGAADAPELNLTWITSLQRLKNGNLVVGNFLRGQEGKGAHAFEITRDKKVVWKYADHGVIVSLTKVLVLD